MTYICEDTINFNLNQRINLPLIIIISIYNCNFIRNNQYNGNGGIIFINNIDRNLKINECYFINCSCNGDGGAIYYNSNNINSATEINNTCCFYCECLISGNFLYFSSNKFINLFLISISKSSSNGIGSHPLVVFYSSHFSENFNSSNNFCNYNSGFSTIRPIYFYNNFCTIYNNNVTNSICIYLFAGTNSRNMLNSNIINNNGKNGGIFYLYEFYSEAAIYNLNNCIFYNNKNNLFNVAGSICKLYILNSKIFHNENLILTSGNLISFNNNNSIFRTEIFINTFNLINLNCYFNYQITNLNKKYFIELILLIYKFII